MNIKKVLGIVLLIGGLALYIVSNYIMGQVNEGKQKISGAQKQIDTGKELFSLAPYGKDIGQELTNPVEKKIHEGQNQVNYYEDIAQWMHLGGTVLMVLGGAIFLIGFMKKKKN